MSESDEAIMRRQLSCKHGNPPGQAFIRRTKSDPLMCAHCGVSEKRWDEIQAMHIAHSSMWQP